MEFLPAGKGGLVGPIPLIGSRKVRNKEKNETDSLHREILQIAE
jgi:hypothetical protein